MKTFLLLLLTIVSYLQADTDELVANIDKTLQKVITQSQKKITQNIKISYDPFNTNNIKQTKHTKSHNIAKSVTNNSSSKPVVSMIFNKKAFINGKWYKENSKFADYVITKINQNIVVLRKKNKYLTLRLPSAKNILITKEEI
jgi:hypothetical protein